MQIYAIILNYEIKMSLTVILTAKSTKQMDRTFRIGTTRPYPVSASQMSYKQYDMVLA